MVTCTGVPPLGGAVSPAKDRTYSASASSNDSVASSRVGAVVMTGGRTQLGMRSDSGCA